MINIMIEISTYILIAILLGYFFGWLITKLLLKERYESDLEEIEDQLSQYKKDNKHLKAQNKKLNFNYSDQKRLSSKDEMIELLTTKLLLSEDKQTQIEKKYEEEIDAFMFEQIDITQKYKDLLEKFNLLKQHKSISKGKDSWLSKLFSSPSSAH